MNRFIIVLLAFLIAPIACPAQIDPIRIIVIGAHPDDCDGDAGGTAILFAQMGHKVKFVSLTNGDAGHQSMGGGALAKIRRDEAREAGIRFGIDEYVVLDNHDGELMPTLDIRLQVIREIRKWKADVVIAPRPNDYHPDHRYTGILVQDAAYLVIVPNIAPDTPPLEKNPVFLYTADHFQKPVPFQPDIAVDITDVYELKIRAMAAHESQFFEWLPWTAGRLDEVPADQEERIKWLATIRRWPVDDAMRKILEKWYGAKRAERAQNAEEFEICEYGKQPDDAEIRRLFPMLKRN